MFVFDTNRALCWLKSEIMHPEWSKIMFFLLLPQLLKSIIYVIINNIIQKQT